MRALDLTALLLLAAGCASTSPHALVRVELPGPVTGPGSPQELQLTQAVRDGAGAEGLVCQPGTGASLLRCTAAAFGNQSRGLTVGLVRSGSGYEVAIGQPLRLPGTASPVCSVQARMRDRIDGELQAPVSRVDARSECGGK
jgi:hypothetical protein